MSAEPEPYVASDVAMADCAALPEVRRSQLMTLGQPWFNRDVDSAEEIFVLLGELYGEPAADLRFHFGREGVPLEETLDEARARALSRRDGERLRGL